MVSLSIEQGRLSRYCIKNINSGQVLLGLLIEDEQEKS